MSSLEDRLAGNTSSVPWIPDAAKAAAYRAKGKDCNDSLTLIGTVVDHFTRDNFNGDGLIDVIVLQLDDHSEVAIHCGPTVLANQMKSARPQFGERIGVKYIGVISRQGSPDYHDYKVVTDRKAGGQIRWAGDPDPVADHVDPAKAAEPTQPAVRHEATSVVDSDDDIPF